MKFRVTFTMILLIGIILIGLPIFLRLAYLKIEEEAWASTPAQWAGRDFYQGVFMGYYDFPRDDGSTDAEQIATLRERWHRLKSGMEDEERDKHSPDYIDALSKYYDARIWTVIKNLPENPPDNLVVLATRNVAPSSLRTRLTESDMPKHIQFDEQFEFPPNMSILKKYAVFIYANHTAQRVRMNRPDDYTYGRIYRGTPFDLTTNPANGLQVKYLTPDGEVIPTND